MGHPILQKHNHLLHTYICNFNVTRKTTPFDIFQNFQRHLFLDITYRLGPGFNAEHRSAQRDNVVFYGKIEPGICNIINH